MKALTPLEVPESLATRICMIAERRRDSPLAILKRAVHIGLGRLEPSGDDGVNGSRRIILRRNDLSSEALSIRLNKPFRTIERCRLDAALAYLRKAGNWQKIEDTAIAKRFGIKVHTFARERREAGFIRKRGNDGQTNQKVDPKLLGSPKEVEFLLRHGGKTVSDLMRERLGGKVTRERARQIVRAMGVTSDDQNRSPLWYANRLLGEGRRREAQMFVHRKSFRKALKRAGSVSAFAKQRNITISLLVHFMRRVHDLLSDGTPRSEYAKRVKLTCPVCERTFYRSKKEIKRERKEGVKHFLCSNRCKWRFARGRELPRKNKKN